MPRFVILILMYVVYVFGSALGGWYFTDSVPGIGDLTYLNWVSISLAVWIYYILIEMYNFLKDGLGDV